MIFTRLDMSFPGGSDGKASAYNDVGDMGSISGLGRTHGEGIGYPLQYSFLENSMDRGTCRATVHGGRKESDVTEWLTLQFLIFVTAFTSYNFFFSTV